MAVMDPNELALKAVTLVLNNKANEAEQIFKKYDDEDILHLTAAKCYLSVMNALMTFEDDKLASTIALLKATEKKCYVADNGGLLHFVKNKMFKKTTPKLSDVEYIERQIIAADCQVLAALLTFLQQDFSSYMRGGWNLRKAWNRYHLLYNHLQQVCISNNNQNVATLFNLNLDSKFVEVLPSSCSSSSVSSPTNSFCPTEFIFPAEASMTRPDFSRPMQSSQSLYSFTKSASSSQIPNPSSEQRLPRSSSSGLTSPSSFPPMSMDIPSDTAERLMSAVCFGYGIFQLCVSLLPPSLLRVIHFLGFEGDRGAGLKTLNFARKGKDIRAPFASLALLWYHTVVRPFFSLDGANMRAGVKAAQDLMNESNEHYPHSSLFLFFNGRVERLKSRIPEALNAYQNAVQFSAQREMELLCYHEIGWCHLILLQWDEGYHAFVKLKQESRWMKSYYAYFSSVCSGAMGRMKQSLVLAKEAPLLNKRKNNQLENFISRRSQWILNNSPSQIEFQLLGMEMLYLWNTIPACGNMQLNHILEVCRQLTETKLTSLKFLIEGAVLHRCDKVKEAEQAYRNCIAFGNNQEDTHVCAFASYELGVLLLHSQDTVAEGEHILTHAKEMYHGYDFENRLNIRIHAALRNFHRERMTQKQN